MWAYGSFGAFWGCWVVVFADFLREHGITPDQASLQLTALSVSSVAVMTVVAPRITRRARGPTIGVALVFHSVGALLIGVLPTGWLAGAFLVTGIGTGLIDVFVNAAGQELEERSDRPILQWVHATYSLGGLAGALLTGAALVAGASVGQVLGAAAALQLVAAAVNLRRARSLPDPSRAGGPQTTISLGIFLRSPWLVAPACVVLCSFFIEGSMDVWSVIYLRRTLGASVIGGSAGFAAFALAMAIGRWFAATVLFRTGYRRTILASGIGSMAAGVVAVLARSPAVAGAAFLVLGFCIAAAAPAAFGLAGRGGGPPGVAIAAMTTVGYTGFVVGPPVMGWLADRAGLRATIVVLVAATAGIGLAGLLSGERAPEVDDTGDSPDAPRLDEEAGV